MQFVKNEIGHIVPTEEYLKAKGIDLRGRLAANKSVNAETIIHSICERASEMIYNFIYEHSDNNARQDEMIERSEFAQNIVKSAVGQQVVYLLMVGDLTRGKPEDRPYAVDYNAMLSLNKIIPEYGVSVLYGGR